MQLTCPHCGLRDIRVSQRRNVLEFLKGIVGIYPIRCRRCKHAMGNQHLGRRRMEIRPLPRCYRQDLTTWSEQYYHPPNVDRNDTAPGGYALSLQFVPVQFREFPPLQGTAFVEETRRAASGATRCRPWMPSPPAKAAWAARIKNGSK